MGGFSLPSTSFLSSSSPPCGRSSRALGRGLTFLLIGTFLLGFVHFVKAETQVDRVLLLVSFSSSFFGEGESVDAFP